MTAAAGFDTWNVFPDSPPGSGSSLAEALEDGCPECGGELREVDPFHSLAAMMLVKFLKPEDREQAERIVEVRCRSCEYVGSAER